MAGQQHLNSASLCFPLIIDMKVFKNNLCKLVIGFFFGGGDQSPTCPYGKQLLKLVDLALNFSAEGGPM